jgi:hypothetical protein
VQTLKLDENLDSLGAIDMSIAEIILKFNSMRIRPDAYAFTDRVNAYVIEKHDSKWEVYYRGKTRRRECRVFGNEREACADLYQRVLSDPDTRMKPEGMHLPPKNKEELIQKLNSLRIREDAYAFWHKDGTYVITNRDTKWEVYFAERGCKGNLKFFDTEAEACADICERLLWARPSTLQA